MDGLTVGLTIGLTFAGAATGFASTLVYQFVNAFWRGDESGPSLLGGTVMGAFAGAALGLVVGGGFDHLNGDTNAGLRDANAVMEQCNSNAPTGKTAVVTRDAIGNPVCSYQ